jgi:4'-phosphopantetheinyl transferase
MSVAAERGLEFTIRGYDREVTQNTVRTLQDHEVHIWSIPLSDSDSGVRFYRGFLSPDELERASRFRFEPHRSQFVLTRGTLRSLLGTYLGISPRGISFQYSDHNKPAVQESGNEQRIEFNLSHTEGTAVFAFTRGRRIGVDIEKLRSDFEADEIAERFFSYAERAALREIPAAHRYEFFFRVWTRKEAYIKALGEGLSHPLHQFDVSLTDSAALLATRPDGSEARRWHLENLVLGPGFIAAAAVETEIGPEVGR